MSAYTTFLKWLPDGGTSEMKHVGNDVFHNWFITVWVCWMVYW